MMEHLRTDSALASSRGGRMRTFWSAMLCTVLVFASASPSHPQAVKVHDVKIVAGEWAGQVSFPKNSSPTQQVRVTIAEDGSYLVTPSEGPSRSGTIYLENEALLFKTPFQRGTVA